MQRVITINLNGNAYQLDEPAFEMLRAYLDRAELQLKENPDRAEIMADFEQAIADKCGKFLGSQKTVVLAPEMDQILKEMGPVEGGDENDEARTDKKEAGMGDQTGAGAAAPRRLYRIHQGRMIAGVCTGLGAYFDIDPTIVRIVFAALLFVTQGAFILAYFALMFVVPEATTSEEHAAAHGAPFNAQELLDQAKRHAREFAKQAEDFAERGEWRQHLHEQKRLWRAQARAWKRDLRRGVREQAAWARGQADWARGHADWARRAAWWGFWGPRDRPISYAAQVWAAILMPVLGLISLVLFVWLAFAIFSLVTTGAMFGLALPAGIPLWAGILILIVLFQLVTSPIRSARHASYYAWGHHQGWFALWDGVFAMAVTCLVFWLVYHYVLPVEDFRHFIEKLPDAIRTMMQDARMWLASVRAWFDRLAAAL